MNFKTLQIILKKWKQKETGSDKKNSFQCQSQFKRTLWFPKRRPKFNKLLWFNRPSAIKNKFWKLLTFSPLKLQILNGNFNFIIKRNIHWTTAVDMNLINLIRVFKDFYLKSSRVIQAFQCFVNKKINKKSFKKLATRKPRIIQILKPIK